MKEATGELNMTVFVVIAVGVFMAFFFYYLWPMLDFNFESTTQCSNAICNCNSDPEKGKIGMIEKENGIKYCTCWPDDKVGDAQHQFECLYKG